MRTFRGLSRRASLTAIGSVLLCSRAVEAQPALVPIKVGLTPTETVTPLLYAVRAGLFERAGLAVEVVRMTSGAAISGAVAGGALDLGTTSVLTLILGFTKGVPFTVVGAANNLWNPDAEGGLLVLSGSTLAKAPDFNGKIIAAAAVNDIVTLSLWAWMDQNGGDGRSLKIVEIPQTAAQAALEQGRVDGINVVGAAYAAAVASPKIRVIAKVPAAIAPRYANTAWFSTRDWVEKNRATAGRFARVMSEAAAYTNTHPEETLRDVIDATGIDRTVAQKMHRATFSTTLTPADLQPVIDVAAKYKVIEKTYRASALISDVASR